MTLCTSTFETGVDGANISVSDAGSATAWDARSDGFVIPVYDNTHVAHGSLAGKFPATAAGGVSYLQWTSALGSVTDHYGRIYIYTEAASGSSVTIVNFFGNGGSIQFRSDGKIDVYNNLGQPHTSTATFSTGQFIRIEWHMFNNSSTVLFEVKLFNTADSTTADDIFGWTNTDMGSDAPSGVNFGIQQAINYTVWIDDIIAGATSYPGPITTVTTNMIFRGGRGSAW